MIFALRCDIIRLAQYFGRLAQLVEHPLDVRAVMGSSPLASTKIMEMISQDIVSLFFA